MITNGTYFRDLGGRAWGKYPEFGEEMSVTTGTFRWTEAYRVNIAVLDQQHQKLFETVNELDEALRTGAGNAAVERVLDKLVEFTLEHFAVEERLLQQHGFPGLPTHRTQHEMFRQRIAAYLEDHRAAKPGTAVSLLFFMQGWLTQHVLKTDKQYSAFLNARGVR